MVKKCIVCDKEFKILYPSWNNKKYCSKKCYWSTLKGKRISPATEFKKGQPGAHYKGGYRSPNGYLWIYKPKHIKAMKSGYVLNAIVVMEAFTGKKLKSTEIVHHINKNKRDDRPENLKIMSIPEHKSFHAKERWKNNNFR